MRVIITDGTDESDAVNNISYIVCDTKKKVVCDTLSCNIYGVEIRECHYDSATNLMTISVSERLENIRYYKEDDTLHIADR